MTPEQLLKDFLAKVELKAANGLREAIWCEDCKEWVEQPAMVCRAGSEMPVTDAHIWVNTKDTQTLIRLLRKAIEQRDGIMKIEATSNDTFLKNQCDADLLAIVEETND